MRKEKGSNDGDGESSGDDSSSSSSGSYASGIMEAQKETFYTEGTQELQEARLAIAKFSIERAQKRLKEAKERRDKMVM